MALARALATSPSLLLLDEPLSALDARVRVRLRDEIKDLQRRLGVTTIMVTHDQEEAMAMADRIVVMNHGVIEQVGTPIEIYTRPATAFVADFVGHMTFFDARVRDAGHVEAGSLTLAVPNLDAAAGSAVRIGFRPEEVQVRAANQTADNKIPVMVRSLTFLGSFCRATLAPDVAGAPDFIADLSANDVIDLAIGVGSRLTVALPPQSLRVFPASGSAA